MLLQHSNACIYGSHRGRRLPSRNPDVRPDISKQKSEICFLDLQTLSGEFFQGLGECLSATTTSSVAVIPCGTISRGELIGGLGEKDRGWQRNTRGRGTRGDRPSALFLAKEQTCDKLMSPFLLYIPFHGCGKRAWK